MESISNGNWTNDSFIVDDIEQLMILDQYISPLEYVQIVALTFCMGVGIPFNLAIIAVSVRHTL